jgi:hypothetical protein
VNFSDAERAEWRWLDQLLDTVMSVGSWVLLALLGYATWLVTRPDPEALRAIPRAGLVVPLTYLAVTVLSTLLVPALHSLHIR